MTKWPPFTISQFVLTLSEKPGKAPSHRRAGGARKILTMRMKRALDVATLLVMAVIAVTTLALHVSGPARPVLLQQQAHWAPKSRHTSRGDAASPGSVLGQQAKLLEASAHTMMQKAQQMEAAGRRTQQAAAGRASQAEEAVAVEKYLQESKTELNAYTKNIEGLVSAAAR